MRRSDKEIKDDHIIQDILSKSEVCRIAMVDGTEPYIVPLNYAHSNNMLFIHSAPEGRKIEVLKRDGRVCFEIEYGSEVLMGNPPCKGTAKFRSLIGYGRIEIATDTATKKLGLDLLSAKYGNIAGEYDKESFDKVVMLVLIIDKISGKQSGNWD